QHPFPPPELVRRRPLRLPTKSLRKFEYRLSYPPPLYTEVRMFAAWEKSINGNHRWMSVRLRTIPGHRPSNRDAHLLVQSLPIHRSGKRDRERMLSDGGGDNPR